MVGAVGTGGRNASTMGGRLPAVIGGSREHPPPPNPRHVVAVGTGGRNVSTMGGRLPAVIGGPNAAPPSVGRLLDADGFVLVLERDGKRTRYAASDDPNAGMTALEITIEVNNLSSWKATLPADRELFQWAFATVVIGYDGQRLFHGQLLPAEGSYSDQQVTVSGYGNLFSMTAGGLRFSCANCAGWEAINQFWDRVADLTDGTIRGYAIRPPAGQERFIGDDPIEFEGTMMEVCKSLHGQFGYAFASDPSDRSALVESFRPGTQTRAASWTRTDHSAKLDPTKYHNRVIIRGAKRPPGDRQPGQPERYRGEARAPQSEIETLTDGKLITHRPKPNDKYTSDAACQARAQSRLDELRGEYSITGRVEAVPTGGVVPGYVYQVPAFDSVAPKPARPVRVALRSVTHTLIGGPKTALDFGSDRGLVQVIRRTNNPGLAPGGIQQPAINIRGGRDTDEDGESAVYSGTWPRPYPADSTTTTQQR